MQLPPNATRSSGCVRVGACDSLRALGEYLHVGDAGAAASLFAEDARYEEQPAFTWIGREQIQAFFQDFCTRHDEADFDVSQCVEDEHTSVAAAEWRWSYRTIATGVRVSFDGMSFLLMRDGLIAQWRGISIRTK